MKIYTIPAGVLGANSYLLTQDDQAAVLIDCGGEEPLRYAAEKGLKIEYVLLTHGHFDHIGGCAAAQEGGAKFGVSEQDQKMLKSAANLAAMAGVSVAPFTADFTFRGGEVLRLCGMEFSVLSTPGHTPGGVCFLAQNAIFTGDTLFCGSIGRTDFPGGSMTQLRSSLQKIASLKEDLVVYPGHDRQTTLSHERKYNPYLA